MMQFFRTLLGVKGEKFGRQVVEALVEMDPKSASLAQLRVMESDLDKAGKLLSSLRADLQRERREASEARDNYARRLAAAEHLTRQIAQADDPSRRTAMETSLANLLTQLENLESEVAVEEREADEAESLVAEAEAAYLEKAKSLAEAKTALNKAERDMERAKIQEGREKERADRAAAVAGLRSDSGSKLTVAVDAMKRRADEARSNAEAARMKAQALTHVANRSKDDMGDPHIQAALAAVGSGGGGQPLALHERLARLSSSKAPEALKALPAATAAAPALKE
jgi:chromosome segregation ATPase